MKKYRTNIRVPRTSILWPLIFIGALSVVNLSCEMEDDTPPPSAYVAPKPEPVTEECTFKTVLPDISKGLDFECEGPDVSFFGEKDGSLSLEFTENPDASGINTSDRVAAYTQTEGVESWAGLFFDLSGKIDFSGLQTIKLMVYAPAAEQIVLLKLEDSSDGTINKEVQSETTTANEWEELSFTFSASDTDKYDRMVLFFDFSGEKTAPTTHYFDNIVMGEGSVIEEPTETGEPTTAAPTPTVAETEVISLFSDAYTNVADTNFNPDWGQATAVSEIEIAGDAVLKYENLNYQGTQFAAPIDASEMTMLHIDYWTDDSSELNGYLISSGPAETVYAFEISTGQWNSVDIPLSHFSSVVDLTDIIQLKFDGNGTIYLDNIYFYNPPATDPTAAAPTPLTPDTDVISLFSDTYTNIPVDTWRTDWSEAALEEIDIDGNATKKYSDLNFVGIETVNNQIDAGSMTHFHTDIWTADATEIRIKLVDFGANGAYDGGDDVEHEITIANPEQNTWISLDIPLSDFTGLTTKGNIAQLIYAAQPVGSATLFIDNVYFHK
ncbi:hypothetical protein [Zobellia galactanivorans]|uniref:hypothetical protein n=1 Tax=Zobellia galactanivorans (strain DSM 12802 / CCUG 47099 / CIP 106680 / NCIMB 13871 / Dsij) TaxID=63186 RepID=UPI001C07E7DA|nr:hypothetical protein [Zobellia galactanivorans]MBU3027786.1 hypothetical protein [Zobellia galactanivorans]